MNFSAFYCHASWLLLFPLFGGYLQSYILVWRTILLYNKCSIIFQEYENKICPWLWSFAVFTVLRFLAWLFFCIVNDLIFAYNIFICLFWAVLILSSIWSWLVVYSLYVELRDLSKLEDLAHLRVGNKIFREDIYFMVYSIIYCQTD